MTDEPYGRRPHEPTFFDSTSRAAGEAAAAVAGHRRRQILDAIRDNGPLAIFEVATLLGVYDHQISGRFIQLERDMLLAKTGDRRTSPSGCQVEVYDLADRVRPAPPTPPPGLADLLGYPLTLNLGDDGLFHRGVTPDTEQLPGIAYARDAGRGGARLHYRVDLVECGGCGGVLMVEEVRDGGKPVKRYRCIRPGCGRIWHLQLVNEPGKGQVLALVMKTL